MDAWIPWLTQHPLGKVTAILSLIWLIAGGWRWWRCRQLQRPLDLPLWWPLLLAFLSPLAILKGLSIGWERFDRELNHLSSLQPWEGLRGLEIVRHATQSFFSWSAPLVSAGICCFLLAVLLTLTHSLWRFQLYLTRPRPPKQPELEEIREELSRLRQLLEKHLATSVATSP